MTQVTFGKRVKLDELTAETPIMINGQEEGVIVTESRTQGPYVSRWKGALVVTTYRVYIAGQDKSFNTADYSSARAALAAAKRYAKENAQAPAAEPAAEPAQVSSCKCPLCGKTVSLTKAGKVQRHKSAFDTYTGIVGNYNPCSFGGKHIDTPLADIRPKVAKFVELSRGEARPNKWHKELEVIDAKTALFLEQAPAPAVEPAPVNTQEGESTMITLKRLSPAQLEIFSRAPHVTITGKHVTFEESNAPALITALEEMPGDQRTRMKCARRVKLATGQEVTIKKRAPAPSIPNTIKVRTSDAQRGVLQFINKRVCAGTIAAETVMHTFIHAGKVGEVITLLEDMHAMKVNTRACSSLIKTLEAHRVEQFTAAPLITAPVQDEWEEDEQFTIQFEETAARVHDPLHGLREVELPVSEAAWGDAYTRVERTLNDYGYSPAGDRVTVARKHISGLLKQLELISVHGHINYDLETALDEELATWGAAVE